jgi:hypothetical protein
MPTRCKMRLNGVAQCWPLFCEELRRGVEITVARVVKHASLQSQLVVVFDGSEWPPLTSVAFTPIFGETDAITLLLQTSRMRGKCRDLLRIPLFQTIAHVTRESTSHAATRSKHPSHIVGLWRFCKVCESILHVIHFDRVRCAARSATFIGNLCRNVPLASVPEHILRRLSTNECKTNGLSETYQLTVATMSCVASRSMEPPKDWHRFRSRRWCYKRHAALVSSITQAHDLSSSSTVHRTCRGIRSIQCCGTSNGSDQHTKHCRFEKRIDWILNCVVRARVAAMFCTCK